MTVSLRKIPSTPAEVAAAVLDAIEAHPEALDMSAWFAPTEGREEVRPDDDLCGTTMCIAGWVAHVTGWTLLVDTDEGRAYAEQDGVRLGVDEVGRLGLGLDYARADVLFSSYHPADASLAVLRHIANPP